MCVAGGRACASARCRCCSALPLFVSPLLDGDAALPVGEPGERQRDDETGGEAAGEDVAPPRRAAPALGDEGLRLLGRRRRVVRARGDPALGFFQRRRAQQQSARAGRPTAQCRAASPYSVCFLTQPMSVCKRLGEPIEALRRNVASSSKKMKLSRASASGTALVVDPAAARSARSRLLSEAAKRDFLRADLGGDGVGAESTKTTVSAWRDQRLDALPPVFEGIDLGCGRSVCRSRAP